MTDCTTCRHFLADPLAKYDSHQFGKCCHKELPQDARRTAGFHLPVSAMSRLVSDGMVCDNYEPWKGAA